MLEPYKIKRRISFFLYNIGIFKLKDDISKCDFLLTLSINPYSLSLINKPITTVDNLNLLEFIEVMEYFLNYDVFNSLIDTPNVNHTIKDITLGLWCSDSYNMKLMDVDEVISKYLTLSKDLLVLDNKLREKVMDGNCLFNLKKINPYIINIRRINDKLLQLL